MLFIFSKNKHEKKVLVFDQTGQYLQSQFQSMRENCKAHQKQDVPFPS